MSSIQHWGRIPPPLRVLATLLSTKILEMMPAGQIIWLSPHTLLAGILPALLEPCNSDLIFSFPAVERSMLKATLAQPVSAAAAKVRAYLTLGPTLWALQQVQRGSTIIAEFALTRGLATLGAQRLLAFDFSCKDLGILRPVLYVFDHLVRPGGRDFNVFSGRIFDAQSLLFVPVHIADIFSAFWAPFEVALCFVLCSFKRRLVLFVPLWVHTTKPVGVSIRAVSDVVAYARTKQRAADGRGISKTLEKSCFLVTF